MNDYARAFELAYRVPNWAVAAACGVAAAALGWAYIHEPLLALLPALLLLSLPLMLSARARFVVVVFGGLVVFQSSDDLTPPKLAYLLALGVSFGAALVRLPSLADMPAFHDLRPLLRASILMFALISVSLPVSVLNDVPQKTWLRDVAPYVLVACAPFFALDAQASMPVKTLRRLVIAGGLLGTLGFTVRWLTSRQIADLSFVPVGLPTLLLASTVFAFGMAILLHGSRDRVRWAVLTSLVLAMLLSTGTRAALILVAAPLAIVFGAYERLTQRSIRLVIATPLVALLVVLGAQGVLRATNADQEAVAARTSLLFDTGDRRADPSYVERVAQTDASWDAFRASPLLGAGPGTPIVWTNPNDNVVYSSTTIDSSVSFLAKFGLLGLVVFGYLVVGYIATVRRFRTRTGGATILQLAMVGFGGVIVAWSLLHNPYEDKGLAIGLMLLLAATAREASDAASIGQTKGPISSAVSARLDR